jgi:WD40 repeat protein
LAACDWPTGTVAESERLAWDSAHFALSPDGRWVAGQDRADRMVIVDLAGKQELLRLPAEGGPMWALDWTPDGTRLAVGLADGGLAVWNLEQVRARLAEFGIAVPSTARQGGE